jgi:hypothetical protein
MKKCGSLVFSVVGREGCAAPFSTNHINSERAKNVEKWFRDVYFMSVNGAYTISKRRMSNEIPPVWTHRMDGE